MEQETKTYFLKNCISFGNENMTKEEEMEIKKGLKNIINNYNSEKIFNRTRLFIFGVWY